MSLREVSFIHFEYWSFVSLTRTQIILSVCAMVAVARAGILTQAPIAYTHGAPVAYAAAPGE